MIIFISGFRIKSETFRSERFNEVLHKKAQSRRHLRSANEKNTLRSWGFRIKSETFRSERFNELLYKKAQSRRHLHNKEKFFTKKLHNSESFQNVQFYGL
ncbi:hypothetical protein D3C85_71880 [compost metagenome]